MYLTPQCGEVHLISSGLAAEPRFVNHLRQLLSPDEQERARRFRFDKHRNAFVVARGLLRIIVGNCVGAEAPTVRFVYGYHGKPALADARHLQFNLSHSGGIVLYALGRNLEIGVDVEYIRPMEAMEDVARHFFHAAEYQELISIPGGRRARAFFNCWTRKEAFIKGVGAGLLYPLDRFQVTFQPDQSTESITTDDCAGSEMRWSLRDAAPSEEYAAAVAVKGENCHFRRWKFDSPIDCAKAFGLR